MPLTDPDSLNSPLRNPTIHITTHNAAGKAKVYSSQQNQAKAYPSHGATITNIYTTSSFPADLTSEEDIKQNHEVLSSGNLGIVYPKGTVCRFVDFAPGNTGMMHRTQSLDYGVVLEGDMIMDLDDDSETHMTREDVAVQRATMHAWRNASQTEWARMLFVLQDCQPLEVGGKRLKEDPGTGSALFAKSGNDE